MVTEERRPYNVGAVRTDPAERRTFRRHVPDPATQWSDIIGADETAELGDPVTYQVWLTEEGRAAFQAAVDDPDDNGRFIEEDQVCIIPAPAVEPVDTADTHTTVPETAVLDWLGARVPGHPGTGVSIGVIDGGTTGAVRTAIGCVLAARRNFSSEPIWTNDQITVEHGCWVTPLAVPRGARLIEAITADSAGRSTHSASAAAMRWMADQGARIINYSSSGPSPSNTMRDAMRYLAARGVVLVASAGNEGVNLLGYPSAYCRDFAGVKSSLAFTLTRWRASFSNYDADASGVAPGERVLTYGRTGAPVRVSGTSFSAPLMARLIALIVSGGRFTATQAADALERTTIDTPEPVEEEGHGAWNLALAMGSLGTTATAGASAGRGVSWRERLTIAVARVLGR